MPDVKFLVRDFFRSGSLQQFINKRFKDKDYVVLGKKNIHYVVMENGDMFYMSDDLNAINAVYEEYVFDDIRKDDIVIDIGATIGDFSIPASRMCDYVYAVEPITTEELRKNISLNKRDNIRVIEAALGSGDMEKIEWRDHEKTVKTMTLNEIKNQCCGGRCNFLKIDCEGEEWSIKPNELKGIRRIEMEVHKIGNPKPFSEMENVLREAGFNYTVTVDQKRYTPDKIIHARRGDSYSPQLRLG